MSEETHPLANMTDTRLHALLRRAVYVTLILGGLAALILWKASGWRNAAMMATGTAISAASILEWKRLIRMINAMLDKKKALRNGLLAAASFVLRLTFFGAAIYVSLRCFRGSVVALLCGLGLAIVALLWEAIRLLRD
jgi:uncharacterized membrane protein